MARDLKTQTVLFSLEHNLVDFAAKVFSKIMKQHCREFRAPRRLTDYCQICADFDDKALPQMHKLVTKTRQELTALLGGYFAAWDDYAALQQYGQKPALFCQDFYHYIHRHGRANPCGAHAGTSFPCGRATERASCSDAVLLHTTECDREVEWRAMDRLTCAYNFHRASNDHQKPCIDRMLKSPSHGRLSMICDWAELMTLPLQHKQTSDSFYGTARKELSIFGAVIAEHTPQSTQACPQVIRTSIIILSDILDHTAARTSLLAACP